MSSSLSVPSLSHLERRAGDIAAAFGGTWRGTKGMCRCPAHDDRSPSLAIGLSDHAILFHCFAGCSSEAVLAAFARHGIRARDLFDGSGGPIVPVTPPDKPDGNAQRLWRQARILAGTPADSYLSSRNLTLRPRDLRFHAKTPLGAKPDTRFLPAMLAAVRTDEAVVAVHRTFLEKWADPAAMTDRTAASVRLARFDRPKRALGRLGTGAVRLATPSDGRLGLPPRFHPVAALELVEPAGRNDALDRFFAAIPARLRHQGDAAYYEPVPDRVTMPPRGAFTGFDHYYATLAHELSHWTGHPSRLARDLKNRFGSEAYAAEELVAEMSSAMLGAELGLPVAHLDSHASYIDHWLKLLRADDRAILTAAARAEEASGFLLRLGRGESEISSEVDDECAGSALAG